MSNLRYDAVAYVIVSCPDCGAEWDEDMTALAAGYTEAWGWDVPAGCPECPDEDDKES